MIKRSHTTSKTTKQQLQQPATASLFHSIKRDWIPGCILFVVTLISYQPALNGTPIWDDDRHMTRPELRSMEGLARIWTQLGATQQYYPLTHSLFWLEYRLWGDRPFGYHIVNILLHFFSALLLVRILRFLQAPGAWLIGAIFALHPVQVESVAWITELKNTLSGVFFFSTALAYLAFDRERKRGLYASALGLFILGLMSKSVIATLPASLLAILWWKRGKIAWKNDIVPLLPFFAAGIASGLFTAWVEHKFIISDAENTFVFSFVERCLIAGRVFWFYLGKIIWPVNLIFIYPHWNINQALWWQYLFPASALLLAGIVWSLRRRWRAPLAAFLYYSATLFPVLGFFNVYPFRYSFVADHFLYLACVGPIAMAIAGIDCSFGSGNRFLKLVGGVILLLALCLLTWKQSGTYTDIETFYRAIIRKSPNSSMAHHNLGLLLAHNGRTDEAIFHYRKSVDIRPDLAESWNNLGKELMQTGQTDEAMADLRKALEINPKFAEAHNNLGILLQQTGRTDEAVAHYQKALEINPNQGNAHNNLGTLLAEAGKTDEAAAHFRKALKINAMDIDARKNLGILLANSDQTGEAMIHFRKVLDINANDADARKNLGILLINSGQIEEAVIHFRKALEINPDDIQSLQNLSAAFEQQRQPAEAIPLLERACALAKSKGDESRVKETEDHLERLKQMIPGGSGK